MTPLGILAGSGGLVEAVIKACQKQSRPYFIVAFEGQSDPEFIKNHPHAWVGLAQIGKALSLLKKSGAKDLVMAGTFARPSLSTLKPDFVGAKWLTGLIGNSLGDDALLRYLIEKLEQEGFQIVGAESLVGGTLLGGAGALTTARPDAQAMADIGRGQAILKILSPCDVGQAVVVQESLILGIEALEGTQALIERTAVYQHKSLHKPVLVKMRKENQEGRVDRPTLGLKTIEALIQAGFAGVAYEAGEVILLDQNQMCEAADKGGIFVYGFRAS